MTSPVVVSRDNRVSERAAGRILGDLDRHEVPREVDDPSNRGRMVIRETSWTARDSHGQRLGRFARRRDALDAIIDPILATLTQGSS